MALAYAVLRRETTNAPGTETVTPTYATKVLYVPGLEVGPDLGPAPLDRQDEIRNIDEPLSVVPEIFNPSLTARSRMYPDTMGQLLSVMLGAPTTTAGNGVITDPGATVIPVGVTRHVWTAPYGPTGVTPGCGDWRLAYRDQGVYFQLKGWAPTSLTITNPESGGAQVTAQGPANYMARISDPGLTPSYEALTVLPFMRRNLTLTWLTGSASTEDFTLTITNPVEQTRTVGSGSGYPDLLEKADGPITVTGSIPKRQLDPDDYDALLNATGFTARVTYTSPVVIASGYPYKLFVEFANAQYVAGDIDALQNRRRHGASFEFRGTTTGAAGHCTITLCNATASYA